MKQINLLKMSPITQKSQTTFIPFILTSNNTTQQHHKQTIVPILEKFTTYQQITRNQRIPFPLVFIQLRISPWKNINKILKLTHSRSLIFPHDCPKCGIEHLTIEHIFTCPQLFQARSYDTVPTDGSEALCDSSPILSNVVSYLLTSSNII